MKKIAQQLKAEQPNGKAVARILRRMAQRGAMAEINDPSVWQREIRKDRSLPGRNTESDDG